MTFHESTSTRARTSTRIEKRPHPHVRPQTSGFSFQSGSPVTCCQLTCCQLTQGRSSKTSQQFDRWSELLPPLLLLVMSCLICGPKLATCGIVISVWGVVMLALLGVFFRTHSAVLIEDVPLTEEDLRDTNPPQKVYGIYNQVAYNCFIAAAVYVVVGGFSFCQVALNRRKEYLVR